MAHIVVHHRCIALRLVVQDCARFGAHFVTVRPIGRGGPGTVAAVNRDWCAARLMYGVGGLTG